MAAKAEVKIEGIGGVGVSLAAAAMAALGLPKWAWIIVLVVGVVLCIVAVVRYVDRRCHGPISNPPSPGVHAHKVISLEGGSSINDSDVRINIGHNPPPSPRPQLPTTKEEADQLSAELLQLGQEIQELVAPWPLTPAEAIEGSGSQDVQVWRAWRQQYDAELQERYVDEFRPRVIEAYQRARVRGFFDPGVEESHDLRSLPGVVTLSPRLIALATRPAA
jgi:hypothetical protein